MDSLPEKNVQYSTQEYWDHRYTKEESFYDWYKTYSEIRPYLEPLLPNRSARILILGCGNSTLSQDMYDAGYPNITSIDYSRIVIEKMKTLNHSRPELEWTLGDFRQLPFESHSFDVAIDKASMDSMCTEPHDPWNPPQHMLDDCNAEVDEVTRVLKPDGIFIYLTFAQPHFRRKVLYRSGYSLEVQEIGEGFSYFLYTLRRGPKR